jgi:hypothetical protein
MLRVTPKPAGNEREDDCVNSGIGIAGFRGSRRMRDFPGIFSYENALGDPLVLMRGTGDPGQARGIAKDPFSPWVVG